MQLDPLSTPSRPIALTRFAVKPAAAMIEHVSGSSLTAVRLVGRDRRLGIAPHGAGAMVFQPGPQLTEDLLGFADEAAGDAFLTLNVAADRCSAVPAAGEITALRGLAVCIAPRPGESFDGAPASGGWVDRLCMRPTLRPSLLIIDSIRDHRWGVWLTDQPIVLEGDSARQRATGIGARMRPLLGGEPASGSLHTLLPLPGSVLVSLGAQPDAWVTAVPLATPGGEPPRYGSTLDDLDALVSGLAAPRDVGGGMQDTADRALFTALADGIGGVIADWERASHHG